MQQQMRTGDFAKALGVSVDTVRRLERRGVITASRDWAGHRRFSDDELSRARSSLFPRSPRRSPTPFGRASIA